MTVCPVRAECKRRFGNQPCIKIWNVDLTAVVRTHECVHWCPPLNRRLDPQQLDQRRPTEPSTTPPWPAALFQPR
jgi:hypothetical protein